MSGELELEAGWARLKAARLRLEADISEFKAEQRIWEATTKGRGGGGGGSSERDLEAAKVKLEAERLELEAEKARLRETKADLSDKVRELERQLDQVKRENERLRYENSKLEEEARKANPPVVNPNVFFDVTIGGAPAGRIVMELFADTTPHTADHFRALCTGEKGVRRNGRRLHYKGSQLEGMHVGKFFWGGSIIFGDVPTHTPMFAENYTRKHTGPGDLVMAVDSGQLIHGSMFYITTSNNSQLDGQNVVIGKVIEGMGVVEEIGRLGTGPYNFTRPVVIADCGQLQAVIQVCRT